MNKDKLNLIGFGGTIAIMIASLILTFTLNNLTHQNNLAVSKYYENQASQEAENPIIPNLEPKIDFSLNAALEDFDKNNDELTKTIMQYNQDTFGKNILEGQAEIVSAIHQNNLNEEELGYLFLPDFPAQMNYPQKVKQINIPLYLQKDAQWRDLRYGSSNAEKLGETGCAIVSLAMIKGFLDQEAVTPQDILDWSQEKYWVHNQGTSWQIFHDFALENDYQFKNYGSNFQEAMKAVNEGYPIIASVEPGFFTEVGHIIVIRGYEDGKVYVNDPNDDPEKMYSLQAIDERILLEEGKNYWAFSK